MPAEQPAYVNYLNTPSANYQLSYYGDNYARLSQIKQSYDPSNLFWNPYGVEGYPDIPVSHDTTSDIVQNAGSMAGVFVTCFALAILYLAWW